MDNKVADATRQTPEEGNPPDTNLGKELQSLEVWVSLLDTSLEADSRIDADYKSEIVFRLKSLRQQAEAQAGPSDPELPDLRELSQIADFMRDECRAGWAEDVEKAIAYISARLREARPLPSSAEKETK